MRATPNAGMAGRTDMAVGYWNQYFTHLPMAQAVARRKQLGPHGEIWHRVLEATTRLHGRVPSRGALRGVPQSRGDTPQQARPVTRLGRK